METEPSVIVGSLTAAATAVIALVVAFGADLTQDQQSALLGVVAVAAPIIASIVIRGKVWSPESAQREVDRAAATGQPRPLV